MLQHLVGDNKIFYTSLKSDSMFENLSKYQIVLASNSPRRKELLQHLGLDFKVRTLLGVDESYPAHLKGEDIAKYISAVKANAYKSTMANNELLITADTIVCAHNGEILGKPVDKNDATRMLQLLSGKTHKVITGVCIMTSERTELFAVNTEVKFAEITNNEINFYIDRYLPYDKAGSYGIQEWIGLIAVEEIHGSFFNVMGLPIQRLYKVLNTF